MQSSLLTDINQLLTIAIRHDATLYAVEYATYTYLCISPTQDELLLDFIWEGPLTTVATWQPMHLYGIAAQHFWQALDLVGLTRLNYSPADMLEDELPTVRLMAAACFRQQRGLGERGRWAVIAEHDLNVLQELLDTCADDSAALPLLPVLSVHELGTLATQFTQWQNERLAAELAPALQWAQQQNQSFLSTTTALATLSDFRWHDGVAVEQLSDQHVCPRQLRGILAWLPTDSAKPIPVQLVFYDARQPDAPATAARRETDTIAFCQVFGYETLLCSAEDRAWVAHTGQLQKEGENAGAYLLEAWQLTANS